MPSLSRVTTANIELRTVDLPDEHALRQWWEVGAAASAERPYDAWPAWEISRRMFPLPQPGTDITLFAAYARDRVLGTGLVVLHTDDNPHLAHLDTYVAPERRRQGIGSAILEGLEAFARSRHRLTTVSTVFAAPGAESPGTRFAAAHGFQVASEEETKLLDLTADLPDWRGLETGVHSARGSYRYLTFEDRCPEELVDGMCRVLESFIGEIPTGDLDLRNAAWTPERLRGGEDRSVAAGRRTIVALALSPEGSVCGFSDLRVHQDSPAHAVVGGTLVVPEHRGHRLGMGMKLATHRRLLELFPQCRTIETWNAGVNAPMNAVNERLGYRVVERAADVQKVLEPPR